MKKDLIMEELIGNWASGLCLEVFRRGVRVGIIMIQYKDRRLSYLDITIPPTKYKKTDKLRLMKR